MSPAQLSPCGPGSEGRAFSATHLLIPRGRTCFSFTLPSAQMGPRVPGETGFARLRPEAFVLRAEGRPGLGFMLSSPGVCSPPRGLRP